MRLRHPGSNLGKQRGKGPIGDRAGRGDPLDLGRFLRRSVGFHPALHRDELHIRCGGRETTPECVGDKARLDRDPARTNRSEQCRPARRQVVIGLELAGVGRLTASLDGVARIRQQRDLVPADQELAGIAGNLLFAFGQREPGQVAHVLGTDAEVAVDPGTTETCPQPCETERPGRSVGLGPTLQDAGNGGGSEISGDRPRVP